MHRAVGGGAQGQGQACQWENDVSHLVVLLLGFEVRVWGLRAYSQAGAEVRKGYAGTGRCSLS